MKHNRSVMKHQFSRIPSADIQRSHFNRSHGYKTTFDSGYLVPFFIDEVLPGDTFNCRATIFARLATPIVPIMDNLFLDTFYFFVPNRLLWSNWERFNGAQDNPGDSVDYLVPTVTAPSGGWPVGSLSDYFGLPTGVDGIEADSFWHRAYNLIYNEWFRDENLQDSVPVPKDDGPDDPDDFVLLRRGKRHDYFTSCLPWPQKGPGLEVPIGGTGIPVTGTINIQSTGQPITIARGPNVTAYYDYNGGSQGSINSQFSTVRSAASASGAYNGYLINAFPQAGGGSALTPYSTTFGADNAPFAALRGVAGPDLQAQLMDTGVTINALREAFQMQRLFERDARGGTRYIEIIRNHFNVISPDARLQRPEYLGGASQRIVINPVAQTASTDSTTPQGNLAAYGLVSDSRGGFTKSFVEHGVIIGLVNVRADLTYQQGLNRMFSRQTRWDFYWPALAHLGEQAVLNKEIYAQGTDVDDDVFGYQERWAEYRYKPSQITGKFRSTYAQSLDYWHLSQRFDTLPTLSAQWIEDNPPIDRIIAVPSEPEFLMDVYFSLQCARPMPVYSVPGLIDHF
ncbi:major capsid protein [Termite gut associated microvirus 1]|nr:major capsid protein [Termite gut associated microvirus 1]